MRGPGLRIKYDVRRLWRCPHCGYERHAPATETSVRCHCTKDEPLMKLVEPRRGARPPAPPLDVYMQYEDFPAEDPPVAAEPIPEAPPEPTLESAPLEDEPRAADADADADE